MMTTLLPQRAEIGKDVTWREGILSDYLLLWYRNLGNPTSSTFPARLSH